jgi:pimeloyl-ACP methyl ester carboxylesterase
MKRPVMKTVALSRCRVPLTLAVLVALASASPSPLRADDADASKALSAGRSVVREAADYSYRRWLRNRLWDEEDESRYGLQMESGWRDAAKKSPGRPLVVLVHGFNSTPQRNAAVLEPVRAAGFPCASFAYPNDWDLRESAALLSRQLKSLAAEHPSQQVALVTHSMGGLVARACVENSELDPGNVTRLVMIAPPSHGTLLAHLAIATDVWEHWLSRADGGCWTRWRDSVIDGLGEAADDLVPGSPFLAELNARPRHPHIQYAMLLGTGASVSQDEMDWLRSALLKTSGRCPGFRGCTGKLEGLLEEMEEIVDGKGDGVVALKRARLEGVDDVVILPFGHLSCTGTPASEPVKQVQLELLSRLQ